MKAFARFLCVLSITAFCVACDGGSGGGGTTTVSTPPPPVADYAVLQLDPLPGHQHANANDINDNGQIVGFSSAQNQTAVLWTIDGAGVVITVQDLGTLPSGTNSIAYGINNLGQIVGSSRGAPGSARPFIWTAADGMRDLGVPTGVVGGTAFSINDTGQVVGTLSTNEIAIWTVDADGNVLDERNLGNLGGERAIAFDNNVHDNVVGDIFFAGGGSGTNQTGFFGQKRSFAAEEIPGRLSNCSEDWGLGEKLHKLLLNRLEG